jgi:hypothetical protein
VTENPSVRDGITPSSLGWALTATHAANWHPLTWWSHMADVSLFGLDAGRHLLVSVALHAANSGLLFLALTRLTGDLWPSAFVAAIFALHPIQVESVAWVAERKTTLSAFWSFVALLAYAAYAARPTIGRAVSVAAAVLAALASKPMAVTLPAVLILLDLWPLRRWRRGPGGNVLPRRFRSSRSPSP